MSVNRLEVRDLTCRYGGLVAVDHLSLDVTSGSIVGLIGPNGAGKTTAVNAICGLQPSQGGTLTLDGEDLTSWSSRKRAVAGISRTFQLVHLVPTLTVLQNVMLGFSATDKGGAYGLISGIFPTPKRRSTEAKLTSEALLLLESIGIRDLANRYPKDVAFASQRRVEIARLLAANPSVAILDEPASGLAADEREELLKLLADIALHGTAVLLIEHDMAFVRRSCNHIYVMADGKLIADGEPDDVMSSPLVAEAYLGVKGA